MVHEFYDENLIDVMLRKKQFFLLENIGKVLQYNDDEIGMLM